MPYTLPYEPSIKPPSAGTGGISSCQPEPSVHRPCVVYEPSGRLPMPYATRMPSAETAGTPPPPTSCGRPSDTNPVACVQRNDVKLPSVPVPTTTEPSLETEVGAPLSNRYWNVAAAWAGAPNSAPAV